MLDKLLYKIKPSTKQKEENNLPIWRKDNIMKYIICLFISQVMTAWGQLRKIGYWGAVYRLLSCSNALCIGALALVTLLGPLWNR